MCCTVRESFVSDYTRIQTLLAAREAKSKTGIKLSVEHYILKDPYDAMNYASAPTSGPTLSRLG